MKIQYLNNCLSFFTTQNNKLIKISEDNIVKKKRLNFSNYKLQDCASFEC